MAFTKNILSKYFPIQTKQRSIKKFEMPWLTRPIAKCIKKKHQFFTLYRKHTITYRSFSIYSSMLNELLSIARINYYQNVFNTNVKNIKSTWKYINILNGKKQKSSPSHIVDNNITYTNPAVIANKFNEYFSSIAYTIQQKLPNHRNEYSNLEQFNRNSMFLYNTTNTEISNIIRQLPNKNTVGDIPTKLLKVASEDFSKILADIFNKMTESGVYPDLLKISRITPVHKKGKTTQLDKYRPISNLPITDKIFEKLLYNRTESFLNKYNIITNKQYGFRKNKDTSQAVLKLFDYIIPSFANHKYSICIFADFSKAFDTVDHTTLLNKLYKYGIRGQPHSLLKSFLSNRRQYVRINSSDSKTLPNNIGVPQGSCLGPLLYNIYCNDITELLSDCDVILYADDLVIHKSSDNINALSAYLNLTLDKLGDWCSYNKLSINPTKTKWMMFSNQRITLNPILSIQNQYIENVSEFKYLGFTVDNKLKHSSHIKTIKNNMTMYLRITKNLINCST